MIRLLQRVSLPFLCALALIFIPLSAWAQSTATTQQDRTDQTGVNQTNQNVDQTQDQNQSQNQNQTDTGINRQKPSETSDPNAVQNQQDANTQTNTQQNSTTDQQRTTGTTTMPENKQPADRSTSEYGSNVDQKNQADRNQTDEGNRKLPGTAGELPLLALAGFASLIGAFATRALAKTSR